MNKKTPLFAVLVLALMGGAQAAFLDTHDDESPHQESIEFDSADVLVTTYRNFTIDEAANAYVKLAAPLPTGYSVDLYLSTDGATYTLVGDDVTSTDPSTNISIAPGDEAQLKAELTLPASRTADTEVVTHFIIALDAGTSGGDNGGVMNPSFAHKLVVYYYNAESDSDGDGLPDAWEDEHFGDLDQLGSDDPDGDGYTNHEEYDAGSDPNNAASTPPQDVTGGGGNGAINDRELGLMILGIFLTLIIAALLAIFLPRKKEGRAVAITLTVGVGIVAAMFILFFLEKFQVSGVGWAWWAYLGTTWQEYAVTLLVLGVTAMASVVTFLKIRKESKELNVAWAFLAVGVILTIGIWLTFGVFDLPVPFIE